MSFVDVKKSVPVQGEEVVMLFRQLIDFDTRTYTYLLADGLRRKAVLIDPVLSQVERDVRLLEELGLDLVMTLETGIHGDHLSGAAALRARMGSQVVVPAGDKTEGADLEVKQGDAIFFGLLALEVRAVPGRKASNVMYVTSDLTRAFVGSTLLIRDMCRVDHPDSDLTQLWLSLQDNILSLPDYTELYPGRDMEGRTMTSVQEERQNNPYLRGNPTQQEFMARVLGRELPPRSRVDANQARNRVFPPKTAFDVGLSDRDWAPIQRTLVGIPEVTAEWVHQSDRNFRVVDVRGLDEFHGPLGHIEGAELVPLDLMVSEMQHWERSQKIVLVCRSGGRSGRAAMTLEEMGFVRVVSMAGGMIRWGELGYKSAAA